MLAPSRRHILKSLAALGVGSTVFQRALAVQAEQTGAVTAEMIQQAEWISGIKVSEADRKTLAGAMNRSLAELKLLRAVPLDNGVPPAVLFQPAPWLKGHDKRGDGVTELPNGDVKKPASDEDLAFASVAELSRLLAARKVSSVELTKLYLERLRKCDPGLKCVVSLTEELALKQAEQADQELAAGKRRGPLHGIPWGAKDLIAYPGFPTTWGAPQYKERELKTKATVAQRLDDAGAVLVAKLSLGALAMGDMWFRGMTRNPWNPEQGSSGSSAGSACATVAGLVGFALGSETLGSIVSPSRRCGSTGLRPTFGRVSRHGCMALSWSMDKIGPLARTVEDCALVFAAIHGRDGLDPTAIDRPFAWPCKKDLKSLRVGYIKNADGDDTRPELKVLKELGVQLVPIKLPQKPYVAALLLILNVEAATAFDELTRQGVTEGLNSWPQTFRQGQFVPAVEYIRANRIRTLLMKEMEDAIKDVDCYVGGNDLLICNLTGHPTVVLPDGFRQVGPEVPKSITFTGKLYGESELLAVAHAYQLATGHHLRHPKLDKLKPIEEKKKEEKNEDKKSDPLA